MIPIYDLPIDAEWWGVDPASWRELPEDDDEDDDEDIETPEDVTVILGFDPDDLT